MARLEQSLTIEVREDNKTVAGWLLYYHERKKDYEQRREAILHSTSRPEAGGSSSYISDTTGRKGQKLGDLLETEEWLALVEEVDRRLPWKMQIVLRLKRRHKRGVRGRPINWLVALEFSEEVSKRTRKNYAVGPDAVRNWWDLIIEYAARIAGKRGLL